jgi:hypothetical protein
VQANIVDIVLQLLLQVQSLHRYFHETLKLPPRSGILIMADVRLSSAWLTADVAALFGAYLSLPVNVSDSAESVSQVIARHQVQYCINHLAAASLLRPPCPSSDRYPAACWRPRVEKRSRRRSRKWL